MKDFILGLLIGFVMMQLLFTLVKQDEPKPQTVIVVDHGHATRWCYGNAMGVEYAQGC